MNRRRPTAITGTGIVSPLGIGVEAAWDALARGEVAARPTPPSERGISLPALAATVDELRDEIDALVPDRSLRRVSALSRMSVAAARLGLDPVQGDLETLPRDTTGVFLATAFGSTRYHFEYYEKLYEGGLRDASPLLFSECVMNAACGHVSLTFGLRGASLALVGGEELGLCAVVQAAERCATGDVSAALSGGTEEYCDFVHAALANRGRVGDRSAPPFAAVSEPPIASEGAALLVLESLDSAAARLRTPRARVLGTGMARATNASQELAGERRMPAAHRAVEQALDAAEIDASEIDLVLSSADGADLDAPEAETLGWLVQKRSEELPVWCPKAALGEGFAFTSAAAALLAVESLRRQELLPMPPASARPAAEMLPAGCRFVQERQPARLRRVLVLATNRRGAAIAVVIGD